MKASRKTKCVVIVSCPSELWLANSLDSVSVLPHPYPNSKFVNINADLENIEQEDPAESLHARILQDILKW